MSALVIIACGAAKLDRPAAARDLYIGQQFRVCLRTALALTQPERIRILSARYGLVGIDDHIAPYDLTVGQPGSVTADELVRQAAEQELGSSAVALCPARYAELLRPAFPDLRTPLAGLGIGRQRHALAVMRAAGL